MNARTATPIRQSRERGSATVELLVVAIALLAFTGGLIGIGRLTSTRAALAGVVREAARASANATTPTQAIPSAASVPTRSPPATNSTPTGSRSPWIPPDSSATGP
jgi:Flp pilus assembly protein TadG